MNTKKRGRFHHIRWFTTRRLDHFAPKEGAIMKMNFPFPPTSEWNFFREKAINYVHENSTSSRFGISRIGRSVRKWLRGPSTRLCRPATCGRDLYPRPDPAGRPCSSGTSAGHGSRRLPTPAGPSRGNCPASRARAGLRLDHRILELEWRGLDLCSGCLGSAPFPRGCLVWRPLGLSRWTARLGAGALALRFQRLE
jgi:hypothetical protein